MSKCYLDHFLLIKFIFAESVQMSSSCDHCVCLSLSCVLADFFEKCSKCVHVKKSCSFFSQFFFHAEISCLLCAHEKLKQNQIIVKKEKKCLILCLSELQSKNLCFWHHQQFLKEHDDKLIQKNAEVFEEKLCFEKKTKFCCFSEW